MDRTEHIMSARKDDIGDIPPFLDCSRPEVKKARAEAFEKWQEEQRKLIAAKAKIKARLKPAKSVVTAPAAETAPVVPKSKPAAPKAPRAAKYADDAVITVLVDSFPHRVGSQAEAKSSLLQTGQTVAEYKAAGESLGLKGNWHIAHIRYCLGYKYISLA